MNKKAPEKQKLKRRFAWCLFLGSLLGFTLSLFRVIAAQEPLTVLLLSWAALIYESVNTLFLTESS